VGLYALQRPTACAIWFWEIVGQNNCDPTECLTIKTGVLLSGVSMKVRDLLSGPTIGSSRTWTIYSGIVLAILWTGTSLEKIPGIGWLGENDHTRYVIMFGVLIFMVVSHLANWMNDYYADASHSAIDTFGKNLPKGNEERVINFLNKNRGIDLGDKNHLLDDATHEFRRQFTKCTNLKSPPALRWCRHFSFGQQLAGKM